MKNIKRVIAGAGLIASIAVTNVDASENVVSKDERARIDREADGFMKEVENDLRKSQSTQKQNKRSAISNEEKLVREGLYELKLEEQFRKSPYLYQKYNGYVDRYIKVAKTLMPEEAEKIAQIVAKIDEKYFRQLCENSYGLAHNSDIVFDVESKNGERHLAYSKDSYLFCGVENSDVMDVFRLNSEYCKANKADCNEVYQFGQDTVCRCESDNDNAGFGPVKDEKPVSSLNKANNEKIAMVQSMLYVKGR